MLDAAVAQDVAEEAEEGQRVRQGAAVDGEQMGGGPAVGEVVQYQGQQRQQGKGQGDWSVVGKLEHRSIHVCSPIFRGLQTVLYRRHG